MTRRTNNGSASPDVRQPTQNLAYQLLMLRARTLCAKHHCSIPLGDIIATLFDSATTVYHAAAARFADEALPPSSPIEFAVHCVRPR